MRLSRIGVGRGSVFSKKLKRQRRNGVETDRIASILESVIFISGRPLSFEKLMEVLPGVDRKTVRVALDRLMEDCFDRARGLSLVEVAGGFQFRTKPENSEYIQSFLKSRPQRMSRPTLETLSIIAYRQPITRTEVEAIRGVDVGGVLGTLLERKLIQIMGRKDVVGRPFVYGTTKEFLEFFGLRDLSSLPSLKELEELVQDTDSSGSREAPASPSENPTENREAIGIPEDAAKEKEVTS
jgi:segregation and condensation protein B